MSHKLIVCGDIHLQDKEPKKSQCLDVLDWIFNSDFNNPNNTLLMLGDLCEINSPYELYEIFIDCFENRSRFAKILIIEGNHECANQSTVLSLFRPLKNVEVITEWKAWKYYNCTLLFLPFYNHEGTNKKPMVEEYSNLGGKIATFNGERLSNEFDYGFGHIEDDTEHFSKKFCDTSKLKVKTWMNGHIHTANIQNGGHYLGACTLNSSTESGRTPYLAIIDGETKEYKLKEIPKFMEYYEVEYPNKLPKIETKYGIFLVKNALDKNIVVEEYSKQAKEMGFDFYARRISIKKAVEDNTLTEKSEKPTFDQFAKSVGLSNEVFDICNEVIRLKNAE